MNISKYIFFSSLICCAFGGLHAVNKVHQHDKKYYVDERAISVTKDGIIGKTKKGFIEARTLRLDKYGVFVYESEMKKLGNDSEKGIHACYCHNPDCPLDGHIFLARKWRKYCSPACKYQAVTEYGCRPD